jgi:hypothetical protein
MPAADIVIITMDMEITDAVGCSGVALESQARQRSHYHHRPRDLPSSNMR